MTWPLFHGLSLAVASLVGRYLGAGRQDLAKATIRLALPITLAAGGVSSLIFWLAGPFLTGLFTNDPAVHAAASEYAVILAASQLFVALESLTEGVLAGAGDTRSVFIYSAPVNALRAEACEALGVARTKTKTGLKVNARLVKKQYPKGIKISDPAMALLNIKKSSSLPKWNYTLRPSKNGK